MPSNKSMSLTVIGMFTACLFMIVAKAKESSIEKNNSDVISGASYVLCNYKTEQITFYTFNGNEIITKHVPNINIFKPKQVYSMLDPKAARPQPVSCKVWYWPAFKTIIGTKGVPGWFINFYDKNNHVIACFRYDFDKDKRIRIFSEDVDPAIFFFDTSEPKTIDERFPFDVTNIEKIEIEKKEKGRYEDFFLTGRCYYLHC